MKIHNESIGHYTHWMCEGRRFSLAGFSDAEWYCILGQRAGERTGLGQVLDPAHGQRLLDVLRRRQHDPHFLFAVPKCLWPSRTSDGLPGFAEGQIDWFLGRENIAIEAYERDRITDDLAREADLYPLIKRLRHHAVVVIGPAPLRGLTFLRPRHFVEIATPNLHREPGGIEDAVRRALAWGRPGTYLVSAGVSAAVIIDQLHDAIPESWFLDCGSIWDAFVGIGGQREWRAKLYADPEAWEQWKRWNLEGKPREGQE